MRRRLGAAAALVAVAVALGTGAPAAQAAGAPVATDPWAGGVGAGGVDLHASINPNALATTVRFEYLSAGAYAANLAAVPPRDGFTGATKSPLAGISVGAGAATIPFVRHVGGLNPKTTYRYRAAATNSTATSFSLSRSFTTTENAPTFALPDNRGWEMVSPVEKNGGEIQTPGEIFGGGVQQGAADGNAVTFSSRASFGIPAAASAASQYIARRSASGWVTENVTTPSPAGAFGPAPDGVPYRAFSTDLARGLILDPQRCESQPCLRGYDLRQSSGGALSASVEASDLAFAGASPDLSVAILSTCKALVANATEASTGPGQCDPAQANLYRWSGGGLTLVNLLPGATLGTHGAALAAPSGAISTDGSRIYFAQAGNLYLRAGTETVQVDAGVGGGGRFETATPDGSLAFFVKDHRLYRYAAAVKAATELTTDNGVQGVLGASPDGSYLYYQSAGRLFQSHGGLATEVVGFANASNYPPATGTARVAANGNLAFLSSAPIGEFDSHGQSQVYLYVAATATLACASCNPTGARATGPSTIPGAFPNGATPAPYKPRVLSAAGDRLFFESPDPLVSGDTNNDTDVYQWEAQGTGSCATPGGCLGPISSGRAEGGASFLDASADGADVFFLTDGSLVPTDPGVTDVYDARIGGGFVVPPAPITCTGDACQAVPGEPEDPTPGTGFYRSQANPPLAWPKSGDGAARRKAAKKRAAKRRAAKKRAAEKRAAKKHSTKTGARR
jgi:hypothetical protein